MIKLIRQLLATAPFDPFVITTSGGKEYPVPTSDHVDISPKGGRLVVWFDDDSMVTIAGLHIVSVEHPVASDS